MKTSMAAKFKGVVKYKIIDGNGNVKTESGRFNNLLLSGFYDRALDGNYLSCKVVAGTGTSQPVVTQTSLDNPITALTYSSNTNMSKLTYDEVNEVCTGYAEWEIVFSQGEVVGNISELGFVLSGGTNINSLDSRVLIKDDQGNPTTITVLESEQLVVTYRLELSIHTPAAGIVSTVDIGGVSHTVTCKPANYFLDKTISNIYHGKFTFDYGWFIVSPENTPPAIFSGISGYRGVTPGSYSQSKIDSDTSVATATLKIDQGNYAGGIGAVGLAYTSGASIAYYFNPKIQKTSSDIATFSFETKVDRAQGV